MKPQQTPERDAYTGLRGIAIKAQQERDAALRERDRIGTQLLWVESDRDSAVALLAAVRALHQPDDTGHACTCGTTWPCATARVLGVR